jgi:hypothetical protein
MKENKPDPKADATTQIDLADVAEVILDDQDVARGTRPPPLPMDLAAAPTPSQAPPQTLSQAPGQLPPPAPRRTMLYALVLVVFFVVSVGGGAIWVRASAPKTAPVAKSAATAPAPPPASASGAASAAPRVITIGPVDMSSE